MDDKALPLSHLVRWERLYLMVVSVRGYICIANIYMNYRGFDRKLLGDL